MLVLQPVIFNVSVENNDQCVTELEVVTLWKTNLEQDNILKNNIERE